MQNAGLKNNVTLVLGGGPIYLLLCDPYWHCCNAFIQMLCSMHAPFLFSCRPASSSVLCALQLPPMAVNRCAVTPPQLYTQR